MPRAIDAIIDHWKATRGKRGKATAFGGLEIHWGPWTLGDQDRVFGAFNVARSADGSVKLPPALYARVLLVKAEDADGNRLFGDAEEDELLGEANPQEVTSVALLIMADLNKTAAAAADPNAPKGQ